MKYLSGEGGGAADGDAGGGGGKTSQLDGQMDKRTDGHTDRWTNRQIDKRKNDNSKNARMECRLGFQFLFPTISISIIFRLKKSSRFNL